MANPSYLEHPMDLAPAAAGRRPRILVVDDDRSFVRLLIEVLECEGYHVSCAYDGREALIVAGEHRFDLIILDVNMPYFNGMRVLDFLRASRRTAKVPVIFITGEPSATVYPRVAQDARASYVKKPLDIENLNSLVRLYLTRYPAS